MLSFSEHSFLYQDPTRSALQVFLPNPELVVPSGSSKRGTNDKPDISPEPEEGLQQGVWINADPVCDPSMVYSGRLS